MAPFPPPPTILSSRRLHGLTVAVGIPLLVAVSGTGVAHAAKRPPRPHRPPVSQPGPPVGALPASAAVATPELGSGELVVTCLVPLAGVLVYRRRRARTQADPR